MRKSFALLHALCLTLLLCGVAAAQANSSSGSSLMSGGSISGIVTDASRRPLNNIQIELLDVNERIISRARTQSGGRYTVGGLPQGDYYVRVNTLGTDYTPFSVRVQLYSIGVTNSGRAYEEVNITLKPKAGSSAAGGSPVFAQEVPEPARKLYEAAVIKLDGGKEGEAGVQGLKQALDAFPTYYMALERLGSEYVKLKQYPQAVEVLTKAVEVNPKGSMSYNALGQAHFYLKQPDKAIESLNRAVAISPDSINGQLWLGIVLTRSGKHAEAEAPLKKALQLGGNQIPDVHMYLAQVYSNTKRYKEAADELEIFLKVDPNANKEQINGLIKQLREKAKS
jgi:Flp pilus assembly protein TadD